MAQTPLTDIEIDEFIKEDKIVYVTCLHSKQGPNFGKFIVKEKDGVKLYTFASFKRGTEYPALPADQWVREKKAPAVDCR